MVFKPRPVPPYPCYKWDKDSSTYCCSQEPTVSYSSSWKSEEQQDFWISSCPQVPIAKAKSCESAVKRWVLPSTQHPIHRTKAPPWAWCHRKYWGPNHHCTACEAVVPLPGKLSQKDLRLLLILLPLPSMTAQFLKQGCHSEKRANDPTPRVPELPEGRNVVKRVVPNLFPKELTLFITEHGEIQAWCIIKNSGGCDKRQLDWL